jgi:hypothetical protein
MMSKDYRILVDNSVWYEPGHYERADASRLARQEARNRPGSVVQVVEVLETYQFTGEDE